MRKRFALSAVVFFALPAASIGAWAGVAMQSFSVTSTGPGTTVFTSIGAQGAPGAGHPGATAAWPVTVDLALLGTLPSSVIVNFPDRAAVTLARVRSEPRGPNSFLWTGRGADCSALFSAVPNGFRGAISCLNAPYDVDRVSNGSALQLTRYDQAGTTSNWEPSPDNTASATILANPAPASPNQAPDQAIDILVLYNEQVRLAFDGPGVGRTRTLQFAHDAVDQLQLAMDNSTTTGQPVVAHVNLVAAKEVARATSGDLVADVRYLATDPEPTGLRDYWAADVVVYITGDTGSPTQGFANIPGYNLPPPGPGFAPYAGAAVVSSHAINPGDYLFAHEFAHTLGANHNPDNGQVNPTPVELWAFGHWALDPDPPNHGSRTIMSYLSSPQCLAYCPRLLNYSNPNVYVDWFRTGTGARNNALTITDMAPITAQYRVSLGRIFADGFE